MLVLGIESSCDETGIALFDSDKGLLANELYSQIDIHREFGGVVPELASRDHIVKTVPLIKQCLKQTNLDLGNLDGVAYTAGPGLAGALMVGAAIGRSLAFSLGVPALAVHHMEGHLLAPMLAPPAPAFPFLALLVSGGHTQLVIAEKFGHYQIIGESVDDAAGEAFDKIAALLGLAYPGGPALAALATEGEADSFHFPRPMTDRPGLDFSFSGLKTAVANTWRDCGQRPEQKANIARAFEEAAVDTIRIKCQRALKQTQLKRLVLAGGVSANQRLRHAMQQLSKQRQIELFYPPAEFCTDNGAMIALAGCNRLMLGEWAEMQIQVKPRWPISELNETESI